MPGVPLDQSAALERPFSAAVLRLLRGIPGYPNLRMIELGCGDAWLLQFCVRMGRARFVERPFWIRARTTSGSVPTRRVWMSTPAST